MSDFKIPQEKYYQREYFSIDEKYDIWHKSGGKCCHCGKEIYPGVQNSMTVDHFIPLIKGGSNRFINLIPLCEDCNKTKDDKIYSMDYIVYIKDKYRKELSDYLNSYLQVTDYIQRHRLLAYDEYENYLLIPPRATINNPKKFKHTGIKSKYKIKLATWDDVDKLHKYLVKYLKKYNELDSEKSARENIIFWLRFGCIYYVERDNEIKIMTAITIKSFGENEDFRGIYHMPNIFVFSYYMTEITYNLVLSILYDIPNTILKENNLKFMPINFLFLKNDKMKHLVADYWQAKLKPDQIEHFSTIHVVIGNCDDKNDEVKYDEMNDDEKYVCDFFKKFDDVTNQIIDYFENYGDEIGDIEWMITSVISASIILKNPKLQKFVEVLYKNDSENV